MYKSMWLILVIVNYLFITITHQIYVPPNSNNNNNIQQHHNYSKVKSNKNQHYNNNAYSNLSYYHTNYNTVNRQPKTTKIKQYKTCPKDATGQYPYELSCNQFLNCWKGRGYVQNCAPGTLFNPISLECDYIHKVECINNNNDNNKRKHHQQINCPEQQQEQNIGGLIIPDYNDCRKFIRCDNNGNEHSMSCPDGKLFDYTKNQCVLNHKAVCFQRNCCNKTNNNQQIDTVKCPNQYQGITKHPYDCGKFLNCANGLTYIQDCAPGTLFNPELNICDFPYNVQCKNETLNQNNNCIICEEEEENDEDDEENASVDNSRNNLIDYDDTVSNGNQHYYPVYTTPRTPMPHHQEQSTVRNWPPPFHQQPNYDDLIDDNGETTVVRIDKNNDNNDQRQQCNGNTTFSCSNNQCITKNAVCDGFKDCHNGRDEQICDNILTKFELNAHQMLAIKERERWNNITLKTCTYLCLNSVTLKCKSFNYRQIDATCFLLTTNIADTGKLIHYPHINYYELISEQISCTTKYNYYQCSNRKCIDIRKQCNGDDDCGDRSDEQLCEPDAFNYKIELIDSSQSNQGNIFVTALGHTGYICDDYLQLKDANVICRELGFPLGAIEVKPNSFYPRSNKAKKIDFMMDDINCLGNETSLIHCDFAGWGVHNCLEQEIAGVICKTTTMEDQQQQEKRPRKCRHKDYWQCENKHECLPMEFLCDDILDCKDGSDEAVDMCQSPTVVRLVNGTTHHEGRIEIRHKGVWGTVCDDDFNEDAAKVICKNLFGTDADYATINAVKVHKEAYFGEGTGPIWLDSVMCAGNESNIDTCYHLKWGEHNCRHNEDVGVSCLSLRSSYTKQHQHQQKEIIVDERRSSKTPHQCGLRGGDNNNQFFSNNNNNNDDVHFRVVQGSVATKGDYPWQAVIRIKSHLNIISHWCGGVIIAEKFILTAAHCLHGYPKVAYLIIAGDYDTNVDEDSEQIQYIDDYYIHPNFSKGKRPTNNDIALIRLKGRGFEFTSHVQPICLPVAAATDRTNDDDEDHEVMTNCTISGFGATKSGQSVYSHQLRAGWVPIQRQDICRMPHVYGDAITDGMLCAGTLNQNSVDACEGDSGGPLACLKNGFFTLYGLTSWGQRCGYANKPGVYVKVSHYRQWIDQTIEKHSKN